MRTLESLLDELRQGADDPQVGLREPLPADEIAAHAAGFAEAFGVALPIDYLTLLRFSNGLDAGMGSIDSIEDLIEQNREVWFDHHVTDEAGIWKGTGNKAPTYIWLGYEGNSAEQIYDLESGEYRQVARGGGPLFRGTLPGLIQHMIFGGEKSE